MLPTKEWIILSRAPHVSHASWVEGVSASLPDEVRDTRKLDQGEKAALSETKSGERDWIVSLANGSEAAHADLLGIMRTLSQRRFAAPAPTPAPAPASLAGATLLGRGRGGGGGGGGGLSTPPVLGRGNSLAPPSTHGLGLRPRAAATAPAATDASAAAPSSAKASRSASKPPKAEPPGTPLGFTYLYSVGDICTNSADANRRVEITEVCTCTPRPSTRTYIYACACAPHVAPHVAPYACSLYMLSQCKGGKYKVRAASGKGALRAAQEADLEYITTAKAERKRVDRERADRERADRERADRERADRERAERERTDREHTDRKRTDRKRTTSPPLAPPAGPATLPAGWKSAQHPTSGETYYYNKTTGASQYHFPEDMSPPLPPPQSRSSPPQRSHYDAGSSSSADFSGDQRQDQIAALRAQRPFLQGRERAEVERDLAVLESQHRRKQQKR